MVKMDIMEYPDESFDVIYCSHVLEHVPDDRKAMREFRRVLKRSGWAILLVPINAGKTYEDARPQPSRCSATRTPYQERNNRAPRSQRGHG